MLPSRAPGTHRILFGGLYDWLDPWPLLGALEQLDRPSWQLFLVRNPNPETTPQRTWQRVESWCEERGWWGERVQAIDWAPADRRFDLFRDVDALVVCHRDGPETWLSLRTRVLDAVAARCAVIVTDGGGTAELLRRHGVGTIVPPADVGALAAALVDVLDERPPRSRPTAVTDRLIDAMSWHRVLEPLARFCRHPWCHPTRVPIPVTRGLRAALRHIRTVGRWHRGPR